MGRGGAESGGAADLVGVLVFGGGGASRRGESSWVGGGEGGVGGCGPGSGSGSCGIADLISIFTIASL